VKPARQCFSGGRGTIAIKCPATSHPRSSLAGQEKKRKKMTDPNQAPAARFALQAAIG